MPTPRARLVIVVLLVTCASALLCSVPKPAASQIPPGSEWVWLAGPGGTESRAWGMSDRGWFPLVVCGDAKDADGTWQAVAWIQGQPGAMWVAEPLPGLDPTKASRATDAIYDERDLVPNVCGYAYDDLDRLKPMHWTRDVMAPGGWVAQVLPTLMVDGEGAANGTGVVSIGTSDPTTPLDIVVGWAMEEVTLPASAAVSGAEPGARALIQKPALWKRNGPAQWLIAAIPVYVFPLGGGVMYSVSGAPGHILRAAGSAVNPDGNTWPQVWESDDWGDTSLRTELPLPPGAVGGEALSIDHAGTIAVVAGYTEDVDGTTHAVAWMFDPDGGGWTLHEIGMAAGYAASKGMGTLGIAGLPAGHRTVGSATDDANNAVAVYWNDAGLMPTATAVADLAASLPPGTMLHEATAIDADERVVGWGTVEVAAGAVDASGGAGAAGAVERTRREPAGTRWFEREPRVPAFTTAVADTDTIAWVLVPTPATAVGDPPRLDVASLEAFPNPFHPDVRISFRAPSGERVVVAVYDVRGRLVRTLHDGRSPVEPRDVTWRGLDGAGRRVASGIYFVRLRAEATMITRKIVLLR